MPLKGVEFGKVEGLCAVGILSFTVSYALARYVNEMAREHFQVKKENTYKSCIIRTWAWLAGTFLVYAGWHPLTLCGMLGAGLGIKSQPRSE